LLIIRHGQAEMRLHAAALLPPTGSIVEIGSGDGNFANIVGLIGRGKDYTGMDIQPGKIREAMKNNPGMSFLLADATKDLGPAKSADCVVSLQTLEHVGVRGGQEDVQLIESIPAGTVIVFSVPNFDSWDHKRIFGLRGWQARYTHLIDYNFSATYQHPKKTKGARTFLFRGVRKMNAEES